jgi:hypothetical protein
MEDKHHRLVPQVRAPYVSQFANPLQGLSTFSLVEGIFSIGIATQLRYICASSGSISGRAPYIPDRPYFYGLKKTT